MGDLESTFEIDNVFYDISDLSPGYIKNHIDELVEIAKDQPYEYWKLANFLSVLPGKWNLSFIILNLAKPVGYAILSEKSGQTIHLHHFMLHPDFRGIGLGKFMMDVIERKAVTAGMFQISLKCHQDNEVAKCFYQKKGFRIVCSEGNYYILNKTLETFGNQELSR